MEELVAVGDPRELGGTADTSDDLCTASGEGVVLQEVSKETADYLHGSVLGNDAMPARQTSLQL